MCAIVVLVIPHSRQFLTFFNPLTTDDTFWRRQILATCYQLAQSVVKIGSALAEKVGLGGWVGPPLCLTVHGGVAAACGKALVNDGWAICLLSAVCLTTLRGNKKV